MEGFEEMKRYRFLTNTFIDFTRNMFKGHPQSQLLLQENPQLKSEIALQYGLLDIENKTKRYLEYEPPNMCIIIEYLNILHSISDSYVLGSFYPTLTGACSLGERIFNIIILKLRDYYKAHPLYKHVHSKDSINDWEKAINILVEWKIIDKELEIDYRKLAKLRNESIHFGNIKDIQDSSLNALKIVMLITDKLFGLKNDLYFWCPGEIYVKKEKEPEPFVREFILPNCVLLGYKHSTVETKDNPKYSFRYQDRYDYESCQVSDEEYRRLRIEWNNQKSGRET
jgi:hypothetical protein